MGKKSKNKKGTYRVNDKELAEDEIILYGSTNGWLKYIAHGGEETLAKPANHTDEDEPAGWYIIGKYKVMEGDNGPAEAIA